MKENFSIEDVKLIKIKINRILRSLFKLYGPFFLGLSVAYFFGRGTIGQMVVTIVNFEIIFLVIFIFLLTIFVVFFIRDYKKRVTPYKEELQYGSKEIIAFPARKYYDPVYEHYLLFHPIKPNRYILLTKAEYNAIENGQMLELHIGSYRGIVLAIKINNTILTDVQEYSFSQ